MTLRQFYNNTQDFSVSAESPLIRVEGISKSFLMKGYTIKALQDVSFEVFGKDFITMSGPSGSGKSTLLNILGLLTDADKGKVTFLDKNVSELTDNQRTDLRRSNIGFVFQMHKLFPNLTAIENILIPIVPYFKSNNFNPISKAKELLERVGLDPDQDRKAFELSGGEQQRVAIARALLNSPKIILADEPSGNLDENTSDGIIRLFHDIHNSLDTGIVLVTHNTKYISIGNKNFNIDKGKLSEI